MRPISSIRCPPLWRRLLSSFVAAYPATRGQTRLRRSTSAWLVGHLPFGAWVRVSGIVDAEWDFLKGEVKEDATTNFVESFSLSGSTFVDVGSNVGYFTLLAASQGARVIAYEPTPAVFSRLGENVALNAFQGVTIVNAAVAEKPGKLTLYQSPDDPEANNLFGDGDRCVQVPAVTLDEDLGSRRITHIDLLKIDAEGAEALVLKGAEKLLSSRAVGAIIIEVNPVALRNADSTPSDVFDLLHFHGFDCSELERFMYKGEVVQNVLAVRCQ